MKPISRPVHGLTDYNYITLVSSAPKLAGFEEEKTASELCRVLSGGILASTLVTRSEWGWARVMPYKTHLALDVLGGLFALGAPWLFGFSHHERARNTFVAMGVFGILAGTMSEPEEMPAK